ncbi:EAL domain, c-di-GMP-specific phosphodiesterase class I (or its enzymatically inactive variant) [Marinobacter daqiaonensis]|uniref:EAL domain, c-di-GMP-specific phosphodiesterase class I (Or its enzymatically inactive variant) n=1 Tax=Marinobacter daqiaonensis TaxID=650891 RepID=A0A1I6GY28_9GAMM|nr:sensor domain-containing phosphodiesterase [Marinobacter daqiaonensis]SFR47098.1 EAL domain, c-di-GMP-specific phosphodiesterase class I (or its enzymatically inactive variant) [Marinobacter daqiaonensis]
MTDYEQARLSTLRRLNILDTSPSESFDRITRMASQLFDLPIAAVSLSDADRQWFKSRVGVDHREIPRDRACCGEVSDTSEVLVVNDLMESEHYRTGTLAESGIRFYAGAPLTTRDGYTLGAMCVLGHEPREITEHEKAILGDLAAMVMAQIDLQHAVGRVDATTGLPNHLQFIEDFQDLEIDNPGGACHALCVELLDYSQAGALHQALGPGYVREVIRSAATVLHETLGDRGRVYYTGPGQFMCLDAGNEATVMTHALRIHEALASSNRDGTSPFMVRPAIGLAPFTLGTHKPDSVLRMTLSASRDARAAENPTGLYSCQSDESHQRRFSLIASFSEALEAPDQLRLVFQPRVDVRSGACVGAEALIRWQHGELGNVSPAEFIPLVENTPMARSLSDWVLREAIAQAGIWFRERRGLRVSINIAAVNLEEHDFTERVLAYLSQQGLPVSAIELELTESGLIGNGRVARKQLDALIDAGIEIAIDDFGTGYSSLAYLQEIPAHVVKVDRSFVDGIEGHKRGQILVRSMIEMAHALGYRVVAEGVETREGLAFLQSLDCDEVQGYLFARPLEKQEFEGWLAAEGGRPAASP